MELREAKNIVSNFRGKTFLDVIKMGGEYSEAIRLVCASSYYDGESKELQCVIPNELSYIGLYPHTMEFFNITPDND